MTDQTPAAVHLDPLAYLIGVEGIALMRAFAGEHDAAFVEERLEELRRLVNEREQLGRPADIQPLTPSRGYDSWSTAYDDPGNGLLAPDFAMVTAMLEDHPGGTALDAACGTGRYAEWLLQRGYQVVGVDASPGMLDVARRKLPHADLRDGDLHALPVESESTDLVVCALALTHIEHLAAPYAEFMRVLRPGGRLVISDTHSLYLGSLRYPLFRQLDEHGGSGYLPGWEHSVADHINAALEAGFTISRVEELVLGDIIDPSTDPIDLSEASVPDPWLLMTRISTAANAAYAGTPRAVYLQLHKAAEGAATR